MTTFISLRDEPSYDTAAEEIIIVDEYQQSKSRHHVVVNYGSDSDAGSNKKSRKINKFFAKKGGNGRKQDQTDHDNADNAPQKDDRDAFVAVEDHRTSSQEEAREEREGGGDTEEKAEKAEKEEMGGAKKGLLDEEKSALEKILDIPADFVLDCDAEETKASADEDKHNVAVNKGAVAAGVAGAATAGYLFANRSATNSRETTTSSAINKADGHGKDSRFILDDLTRSEQQKSSKEVEEDKTEQKETGASPSTDAKTGAAVAAGAAAVGGAAYLMSSSSKNKKEDTTTSTSSNNNNKSKQKKKRLSLFCNGKDYDSEDEWPLNAHDEETKSVLTSRSARSSGSSSSSPRAGADAGAAVATGAVVGSNTATMKKRRNGGIAKRAAAVAAASTTTNNKQEELAEESTAPSTSTSSKAKTGAVVAGAAAAAAGGAYLLSKAKNNGEKDDAATAASSKSSTSNRKREVPPFFATPSTNTYHRAKAVGKDDDASSVLTPIPPFFASDKTAKSAAVASSTKSSAPKSIKSSRKSRSKSSRKGWLFLGAGAGACAAAIAANRSRKGRQNKVNNARKLTAQERIVAAHEQVGVSKSKGKNTDAAKGGFLGFKKRPSFVGHRYRVTIDEAPSAREAAFGGPPRYDWIDIETVAVVKTQAVWRRYQTVKALERQGLTTTHMRNRRRANRAARRYRSEYNTETEDTGCLGAFDMNCGYDCGLDGGCGLGTRRGVQNDDVPAFMACCGLGNLFGDATAEPDTLAYEGKNMTLDEQRELEDQRHKELQKKYVFRQKTNDEVAEALEVVDH